MLPPLPPGFICFLFIFSLFHISINAQKDTPSTGNLRHVICNLPNILATCKSGEFQCKSLSGMHKCMPSWFKCDGKTDCLDLDDEKDCPERSINCTENEFK
jgi:hypothetical protein